MAYAPASLGEVRSEGWFHYKFRRLIGLYLPPPSLVLSSFIFHPTLSLFLPVSFSLFVSISPSVRPARRLLQIAAAIALGSAYSISGMIHLFPGIMYSAFPALPLSRSPRFIFTAFLSSRYISRLTSISSFSFYVPPCSARSATPGISLHAHV